jgi:hypothetical protein
VSVQSKPFPIIVYSRNFFFGIIYVLIQHSFIINIFLAAFRAEGEEKKEWVGGMGDRGGGEGGKICQVQFGIVDDRAGIALYGQSQTLSELVPCLFARLE